MSSAVKEKPEPLDKQEDFPTILVVASEGLRHGLVPSLRWEGYLVLEARSEVEAFHVVISQSRVIHVLVVDVNMNGYNLARTLKEYRCEMHLLFVSDHAKQSHADGLSAATALADIRKILKLPKDAATSAQWNRSADANFLADFSRTDPFGKLHSPCLAFENVERPVEVPHIRAVEAFKSARAFKEAV